MKSSVKLFHVTIVFLKRSNEQRNLRRAEFCSVVFSSNSHSSAVHSQSCFSFSIKRVWSSLILFQSPDTDWCITSVLPSHFSTRYTTLTRYIKPSTRPVMKLSKRCSVHSNKDRIDLWRLALLREWIIAKLVEFEAFRFWNFCGFLGFSLHTDFLIKHLFWFNVMCSRNAKKRSRFVRCQ